MTVKENEKKTETYSRRKTDGIIGRGKCALVVVDVQEKLMPVIAEKENVLLNVNRLLRICQLTDIPVVVTEQEKLGCTAVDLSNESAVKAVIRKIHFNCFCNEHFSECIARTGRKTLIIAGVEAHICVTQTVLHALPFYDVHVVSDAVSSRTAENRYVALQRMRDAGAIITSTEMFIYEILERAGTDEFRAILPLIK